MNFIYAIAALVILVATSNAQEPSFIQHDLGEAIEGVPIYALVQDHQCMIWLGTAKGLARYDGNALHPVALRPQDSLLRVTALFEDKDHRLWIGASTGAIYYLDESRSPHRFDVAEGHPRKTITAILQDAKGFIWFSTYGEGVYVYTGARLFNIDMDDGLTGEDVYDMTLGRGGEVWLATDDGINICLFENETKLIRTLGLNDGLPDQIITALRADVYGNVWIGTFDYGVVYFDQATKKVIRPFEQQSMDEITSFTIFDGEELWIGTRSSGVWRYHRDEPLAYRLKSLKTQGQDQVTSLLADVEGNVWMVTEGGLLLSAFRPFETLRLPLPEIQTLFCDRRDQLWIGTRQGLYRVEDRPMDLSWAIRILPHLDLNITSIQEDRFQNLWIGTLDFGLYIYHPGSGKIRHIGSIIDQGGKSIMSMAGAKERIWLATLEGVVSFPTDQNIMTEAKPEFQLVSDPWQSNLHFVFHVFVDSKDRVWFATDGKGVYCIDNDDVIQHNGSSSIPIKTVYSICEDHRGHLWFNTSDLGLVEFDGVRYEVLNVEQGLGNLNISSMISTGNGNIILAHRRGVDLMEPDRRHFMYYNDEIGIEEFEPGLNSITRDSRGHVYVSGRNLILKGYATKNELSIHPKTQLTDVLIFEKKVDFHQEHLFSAAQNYISFHYVGLWYTSPAAVKYLYKLEGYDLQWKESRDNVASYSNLSPGEYTFFVKASENNFFLDEPLASYSFTIKQPFWKQIWFIGLAGFIGVSLAYWLVKSRDRRIARQTLLKKEMIESQLSALKAQINPHFLFNSFNTLITIIDENVMKPEVAIEYVEKLSDFYRSILQYREQESISLEEEWTLVHNYVYLLEKRYGANLRLKIDKPPKDAYIFPLTVQMLIENAVKHNIISELYPLDVSITVDDDQYVTVTNNLQPKSRPEPSTQFGLQSILTRYQLLSERKVIIEKDETFFKVRIPIIKKSDA